MKKSIQKTFLDDFKIYLFNEGRSLNTVKGYILNINIYLNWFQKIYQKDFSILTKEDILSFKNYLLNNKNSAKSVNHYLSALKSFNDFLVEKNIQEFIVVEKRMNIKIQSQYASPTDINEEMVTIFRQKIQNSGNLRNYALVTLLAYTGLRISEALSLKFSDFNLNTGECIIRSGKGGKQRTVPLNKKIINAISDYIENTKNTSEYLFISNKSDKLDRTVVNRFFNVFSDKKITPHDLRHFFCTNALEKGFGIHEVANIAGHSNIQTTLLYTNPNKKQIHAKMELL